MSSPAFAPSPADGLARLARDVKRGLGARPRWMPPKYFHDDAGPLLFERITRLPEYYLTRAEDAILRETRAGRRLILFFGSTIGDFPPPARHRLLRDIRRILRPCGRLLPRVDP